MRIVIDMQGAQSESRFRGIGRYTMSLALALARNAKEHEIWLVVNAAFPESILDIRHAFKDLIPEENIRVFKIPLPVEECNPNNQLRTRTSELLYENFLEHLNPDIVLISSIFDEGYTSSAIISVGKTNVSYKTAAILYDLIPFLNPKNYLPEKNIYDYYMRRIESLKNVDLLLAISKSSKEEAIEALNISKEKIYNISTAVDESFEPKIFTEAELKVLHQKYGIDKKMLMYAPGGFDIRKNFEGIIQAYALLPNTLRQEHQLVIVSKIQETNRSHLTKLAYDAGLKENEFILTGYVSDEDLIALYSTATLFVFPSKHEGFGLPILEAMVCGAPVIGSNTTSIPEVIGLDKALFNPDSILSISNKIKEALEKYTFREELKRHAKKQVKKFSWDISAKLALQNLKLLCKKITSNDKEKHTNIIQSIATIYANTEPPKNDLIQIASSLTFNTPNNTQKQLFLDISVLVHVDAKSGIQRVVRSILTELINNPPKDYVIYPIYFDKQHYRYAKKFISNFLNKTPDNIEDHLVDFKQDDIYLSLDLNAHLVHDTHIIHKQLQDMGLQVYFIVYDILFVNNKEWWEDDVAPLFNKWLESITEIATGLICISNSVANEVSEWIDKNPHERLSLPKIKSFYLGADIHSSIPSKGLPKESITILKQLYSTPSFLMVGTIEPRKGHKQTLDAFEKLWDKGMHVNLVIVGKKGWLVEELTTRLKKHLQLEKQLFWLEGISDEYLEKVYATSTCLIAASKGEGFGLPLIEAAQKKMPIIARDIPVFREVAGKYAYYFKNSKDPEVMTKTIEKWLVLYKNGNHPKSDKMPWLTWQESTKQLLHVLGLE